MLLGVGAVMAMGCLGCTVFLYKEFVKELKR